MLSDDSKKELWDDADSMWTWGDLTDWKLRAVTTFHLTRDHLLSHVLEEIGKFAASLQASTTSFTHVVNEDVYVKSACLKLYRLVDSKKVSSQSRQLHAALVRFATDCKLFTGEQATDLHEDSFFCCGGGSCSMFF